MDYDLDSETRMRLEQERLERRARTLQRRHWSVLALAAVAAVALALLWWG